ncbi:PAAR domain-containing protein [[Pseudomonas] boreopolis]|uniref:PAAR domain-containing protein n=1 Tax=Xanthomonas boreopolis TaxID=86183 RepID=UPI003D9ACB78
MSRPFILVGDRLDHGGSVVSGSGATDVAGKQVARVGDRVVCSKHGQTSIVSGDGSLLIDGSPVARHGDKTACGGTLISSQMVATVDSGGGGGAGGGGSSKAAAAAASVAAAAAAAIQQASYDQAIRFVGPGGHALANVGYTLHLANGETHQGVTDENGMTQRVQTEAEQQIVKAELSPSEQGGLCCARDASDKDSAEIELSGISTTSEAIGSSVQEVKAKGHERPLTSGEIAIARQVFGDSVDYSKVKIHNHGYWLFFGLQDKYTAVTPNGEMYMPKEIYKDDYSLEGSDQSLFVHEMGHVWQYQLGYAVKLHGLTVTSKGASAYRYTINPGATLSDFNMEQQADILSDYYMIVLANDAPNARGSKGTPEQLKSALAGFLADPKSKDNLPK